MSDSFYSTINQTGLILAFIDNHHQVLKCLFLEVDFHKLKWCCPITLDNLYLIQSVSELQGTYGKKISNVVLNC